MTLPPQPRYSKGIERRGPLPLTFAARMADAKPDDAQYIEVEIRTKDAKGGSGILHAEFLTTEPDPQKAAHIVSDAAVKKFGNNVYREIDAEH